MMILLLISGDGINKIHINRKKMKGPEFLKYVNPVLKTLQGNGGAGNSSNVIDQVVELLEIKILS